MAMDTSFMGAYAGDDTTPPSFCYECGEPYPWVEERVDAARELAEMLDKLSPADKDQIKLGLDDLVRDSPRTQVAAMKFKQLVAKAGQGAIESMREILASVAVEAAKKIIWPTG
jgi:hypothetical protein